MKAVHVALMVAAGLGVSSQVMADEALALCNIGSVSED